MRTWTQFGATRFTHDTFRVGSSSSSLSGSNSALTSSNSNSETVGTVTYTTTTGISYETTSTQTNRGIYSSSNTTFETFSDSIHHPRLITTTSTDTTRFTFGTDTQTSTSTYTTASSVLLTGTSTISLTSWTYTSANSATVAFTDTVTIVGERYSRFSSGSTTEKTYSGTVEGTSSTSTSGLTTSGTTTRFASYAKTMFLLDQSFQGDAAYYFYKTIPFSSTSTGRFTDFWELITSSFTEKTKALVFSTNSGITSATTTRSTTSLLTYSDTLFDREPEGLTSYTSAVSYTESLTAGTVTTTLNTTSGTTAASVFSTWVTRWTSQVTFPRITYRTKLGGDDGLFYSRPPLGYVGFGGSFDLTTPIYASFSASLVSGSEPPGSTIDANMIAASLYAARAGRDIDAFPVRTVTTPLHMPLGGQNYVSSISLTGTATLSTIFTDTDSVRYAATYAIWPVEQITGDFFSSETVGIESIWGLAGRKTGYCGGINEFGSPYTLSLVDVGIIDWTQYDSAGSTTSSTTDDRGFITITFPNSQNVKFIAEYLLSANYFIQFVEAANQTVTDFRQPYE